MAVTQQLARVDTQLLDRCQADVGALLDLVAFRLLSEEQYLDLDWAPVGLTALARLSGQPFESQAALAMACEGTRPVNPRFPLWEVSEYPFGLDPREVKFVSVGLSQVALDELIASIPASQDVWNTLVGSEQPQNAHEYYRNQFNRLRQFFLKAAEANQGVVLWSD